MVSQEKLARQFENGAEEGRASNVSIMKVSGGYTLLVGYGHAVYAARSPEGKIVGYRGWYGYSKSTSCQLTRMKIAHPEDTNRPEENYESRADWYIDDMATIADWEEKGLEIPTV